MDFFQQSSDYSCIKYNLPDGKHQRYYINAKKNYIWLSSEEVKKGKANQYLCDPKAQGRLV